jgi:hypothetical protein
MENTLSRDHPILIVETLSKVVEANLVQYGYHAKRLPDSPNILFQIENCHY